MKWMILACPPVFLGCGAPRWNARRQHLRGQEIGEVPKGRLLGERPTQKTLLFGGLELPHRFEHLD